MPARSAIAQRLLCWLRVTVSGKTSVVRENTNGANGLALTRDGELLFAEGDGKRISKRNKDGTITSVTEGPPGSTLAPMQKFDSSGKFQKAIGADKFAVPHGFYVDREGNVWGGDQIARNGNQIPQY